MRNSHRILLVCLISGCSGAPAALASDGVLEISQVCAAAGCFSGDTAGFPITIDGSAGKSYLLTSSLVVPNHDTTAVEIVTAGISLDLNGFAITGTTTCSFSPYANCSPTGTGDGVAGPANISVRNGIVNAMGGYGLDLGFDSVVENVRVLNNGLGGIRVGPGSSVRAVTANANGGFGVSTAFRSGVYATIATNNTAGGIQLGQSALVRDSVVHSNGGPGIECLFGCLATANQVSSNLGAGMIAPATCDIRPLTYGGNQIGGNFAGIVTGCGVQLGQNVCDGSTAACP